MRMMKTLWPLCVAALALGLNGCGGGDATRPEPPSRETPVPEAPTAEAPIEKAPMAKAPMEEPVSYLLTGETAESVGTALEAVSSTTANATAVADDSGAFTLETGANSLHVKVMRTGAGDTMVAVTNVGANGQIDAAGAQNPDDVSVMMTERAPPDIEGWHEARFVSAEEGTADDYVNLYTDILAAGPKAFAEVYTNLNSDGDLEILAAHASLVDSGDLHLRPNTEYRYKADVSNTMDDEAESFDGMLQGAPGTFRCDGSTDCTVTTNADGELDFGNGWVFIPGPNAKVLVDDDDYLTFGYWTRIPEEGGDWVFTAFSSGSMPYGGNTPDNIEHVRGSAEYNGAAGGVFVQHTFASGGTKESTAGAFTAKVALMASFGGGGITANNQFAIGGDVTNFVDSDGNELAGWSVELNATDFSGRADTWPATPSGPGSGHTNAFGGTTESSDDMTGTWRGTFYGPSDHVSSDATGATDPRMQPTGVAGEFDADFTNGTVVGAFGAHRAP